MTAPALDGLDVRPATSADLAEAIALLVEVGLAPNGIEAQFGEGYVVAYVGHQLAAMAGVEVYGRYGLLRSVAVRKEFRSHGLGEALTNDRLRWAESRRLAAVYLLTTTAPAYWPKFGFRWLPRREAPAEIRESVEWAHGCPETAVAMMRPIRIGT